MPPKSESSNDVVDVDAERCCWLWRFDDELDVVTVADGIVPDEVVGMASHDSESCRRRRQSASSSPPPTSAAV